MGKSSNNAAQDVQLAVHADQQQVEEQHLLQHAAEGPAGLHINSSSTTSSVGPPVLVTGNRGHHEQQQQHHHYHGLSEELHHLAHGLHHATQATHDYIVRHHRTATTLLIAVTRLLDQTDATLLPAVYFYVGCAFNATPAQLGGLTFSRLLVASFASPLGGLLGHRLNRVRVVACCCWWWSLHTTLFAFCNSVGVGMLLWALNGIGLGVMIPNAQSLVADYYDATHRGKAFGMLLAVGNIGSMLSSIFATNIAGATILGLAGWRVAFLVVAAVSAAAGAAMWAAAKDPRCSRNTWQLDPIWRVTGAGSSRAGSGSSGSSSGTGVVRAVRRLLRSETAREMWVVLTTPSFVVVVMQGFLGSMPWAAFAFTTLFLQLQGWSDAAASSIMAMFAAADAVGAFLGGVVGDWAAVRAPNHGRILVCQFSVGIGIPLCLLIFQGLPMGHTTGVYVAYAATFSVMGLLITWAATACNNPIFAEIVPPKLRTLVYAFDRCFEGALSALGAPMVGVAAQKLFHFSGTASSMQGDCSSASRVRSHEPDLDKARALGNALTLFSSLPWTLCVLVYTLLHCTYPRDKHRPSCSGGALPPVAFTPLATTAGASAAGGTEAPDAAAAAVPPPPQQHQQQLQLPPFPVPVMNVPRTTSGEELDTELATFLPTSSLSAPVDKSGGL